MFNKASFKAPESRGGTTKPASRATRPLSPTSVTMTGKPQAIASLSATEVPSPKCDASMKISAAEYSAGISSRRPSRRRCGPGGKCSVPSPTAIKPNVAIGHRTGGCEHPGPVFHRIIPTHRDYHNRVIRQSQRPANRRARHRIEAKLVQIDPVGNQVGSPRPEAEFPMGIESDPAVVENAVGERRQHCAGANGTAHPPRIAGEIREGAVVCPRLAVAAAGHPTARSPPLQQDLRGRASLARCVAAVAVSDALISAALAPTSSRAAYRARPPAPRSGQTARASDHRTSGSPPRAFGRTACPRDTAPTAASRRPRPRVRS